MPLDPWPGAFHDLLVRGWYSNARGAMMKMRTLLIGLVFLNFTSQAPAGGEDSPDLKKLKLFPDKYEGKTIVLKNIQYLHKIERQYDQFTFHVNSQGTFIFMLKEAANEGSLAMITSPALAEKL